MLKSSILWNMVLLSALLSTAGQAQEKPKLETVRKGSFTGRDRDATRAWVDQEMKMLFEAKDAAETIKQGAELLFSADGLVTHFKANDASKAFQQGMAEIVATAFKTTFQAAPKEPTQRNPLAATYVLTALKIFDDPRVSLECFTAALTDPFPGVRLAALEGLLAIRERATPTQWQAVLGQLQNLAVAETDGTTLSLMYTALTEQDQSRLKQTADILVKILDARLSDCERNGRPPLQADAEAIDWLSSNINQLKSDPIYNGILTASARLLADAAENYVLEYHDQTQEHELEIIIFQADEELEKIATAADKAPRSTPNIGKVMTKATEDRKKKVKAELLTWIGGEGTKGYLNNEPFNLSAGLIKERVPRTQEGSTAPASPAAAG